MPTRCGWVPEGDELYTVYHDQEWGVPQWEDTRLFELLLLEGAQAGLSWRLVLGRRENYRAAFEGFDPERVARFDEARIAELLQNEGLIRNRLKLRSAVNNAQCFLAVAEQAGSFSQYLWDFVEGRSQINTWGSQAEVPPTSPLSDRLSKDLRKRGFNFVGSTICYSYLQAAGLVMDHITPCFRFSELSGA